MIPKPGTRIRLVKMDDDPDPLPVGSEGTVMTSLPQPWGSTQICVDWDNGRTLMLVTPPDTFTVIGEVK